jgi:hypothetical protein
VIEEDFMIYITGDTHGIPERFEQLKQYGEAAWTGNDTLIICGDFGYLMRNTPAELQFLDELEKKPYTICFCDGNHENFPAIFAYPCEDWNGGKIHRIRKNIIHLMRGQIFTIEEKTFFVMGGAYSLDRASRTEGLTWWKEELPTDAEYKEASANLGRYHNRVDYVITHTAPTRIIYWMRKAPDPHDAPLTGFLEWVMYEVAYRQWFFGHWHLDETFDEKHRALLNDVVSL